MCIRDRYKAEHEAELKQFYAARRKLTEEFSDGKVDMKKPVSYTHLDVYKRQECIRCGMCVRACPTNAVCFRYGFGNGKETPKKTTMEESK